MREHNTLVIPRNGIKLLLRVPICVVAETALDRQMAKIFRSGPARTCAFPQTVEIAAEYSFYSRPSLVFVTFNNGLRRLEKSCFENTGIRQVVLPENVQCVCSRAFSRRSSLVHADLRKTRGLKLLGDNAFDSCEKLRHALLNEGLKTICGECFRRSGLEEISIPDSARNIGDKAFTSSGLASFAAPSSLLKIGERAFSAARS